MTRSKHESEVVLGVMLFALITIVLTSAACAGLFVLYYAKLKQDNLVNPAQGVLYPVVTSTGVTLALVLGSAASGIIGQFFHLTNMPPVEMYVAYIVREHALPFWVELTIALYAIWFGVKRRYAGGYRLGKKEVQILKAAMALRMALVFVAGDVIAGVMKWMSAGCAVRGPLCVELSKFDALRPVSGIVAKLVAPIDAWLALPETLMRSFGNQFILAHLAPGILGCWALAKWMSARSATTPALQHVSVPLPSRPHLPSTIAAPVASQALQRDGIVLYVGMGIACMCACVASFYVVSSVMD